MNQEPGVTLPAQIAALTSRIQASSLDERTRLEALNAARGLLASLELPIERAIDDVVLKSPALMALRMGVQLGIFIQVRQSPENGVTVQDIANKSGANVLLIEQIIRLLAVTGYVNQVDAQTYKPSTLTMLMADPSMEASTRACFDIGNACTSKAPEFFRRNNNQFPGNVTDTPFQLAFNTELSYFEWMSQNPETAKDFQQVMALKQKGTSNWINWFDIQGHILDGFNSESPDSVLMVDVGAGEGIYLHQFKEKFPNAPGRLVLQDLPHVVSTIANPPPDTELMSHDIFTAQPVQGARTYFMHWILHDWTDDQCRSILSRIVDAMEPGYSRLIIHEAILQDMNCDISNACISVMMMVQVGAYERSEKQWRDLLASVGLTRIAFYQPPGTGEGIIEAIK